MKFWLKIAAILSTLSATVLQAQTPQLTISTASLNIHPSATDSYDLVGAFSGLDFGNAQSVMLQVGPFSAAIPMSAFVRQPSNVLTYQDSTGQKPYWISSLTIDTNANTFIAQATGVVLGGIANPFAVQLGTDRASSCSMVRVQQASVGAYQLTPGDGVNEPCQILDAPSAEPPAFQVGAAVNVVFHVDVQPAPGLDPTTLQVFPADVNAQPNGGPICNLSANSDGTYLCTASFNPTNVGTIPLVIQGTAQATAGNQTILSPGFSVRVLGPASADDQQQVLDIENTMSKAQQDIFGHYGDTAYSRILSMKVLRDMMSPQPGLTGQPVELCPDGLSIGVRSNSGLMVVYYLINELAGQQLIPGSQSAALVPRPRVHRVSRRILSPRSASSRLAPSQEGGPAPVWQCGQPTRDIARNSNVLLWDPAQIFFGAWDPGPNIAQILGDEQCPPFHVDTISGPQADFISMSKFPNYGTVIMTTHGGIDSDHRASIMTGEKTDIPLAPNSPTGLLGAACAPSQPINVKGQLIFKDLFSCFVTVYSNWIENATSGMTNTFIYAALCFGDHPDLDAAFAPPGSNNAYFAFDAETNAGDIYKFGSTIFNGLVHQHQGSSDAQASAALLTRTAAGNLHLSGDGNLAYLGNPVLSSPQQGPDQAYALGPGGVLNLQAQLDGASGCGGEMNYVWTNTAMVGHLTPSGGGGERDNFTNTDAAATYTAANNSQGIDVVTVDFYPDLADQSAARACTAGDVTTQQILRVTFDGMGAWTDEDNSTGSTLSADLTWHAAWDVTVSSYPALGLYGVGGSGSALPGTSLTGVTTVDERYPGGVACSGIPVVNPTHSGVTTALPQSPYLGALPHPVGTSIIPMWVETFGGDDYSLCDKAGLPTVGNYGPPALGYPNWDTPAGTVTFNINVNDWQGQPDHTAPPIPINFDITTLPGGYDTGETHVTGMITLSSRTATSPAPSSGQIRVSKTVNSPLPSTQAPSLK